MLFELWITCGVLCVFGSLLLVMAYARLSAGVCTCKTDMTEKVVLVTGASSGIGLETARELVLRGARVIIGCRDLQKGRQALQDIVTSTGNPHVVLKKLDLSCLVSVRGFAEDLLTSHDRLDVLVNNAGVMTRTGMTEDGLKEVMATNYLGPFLLTNLLLPLLKKSAPSRIIVVGEGSMLIRSATMNFERLSSTVASGIIQEYAMSKLAILMFVQELAVSLEGTGITVNSLHPGYARTELARELPKILRWWLVVLGYMFFKSPQRGAQTSIHLAVSEGLKNVSGKNFLDCREGSVPKNAKDKENVKLLWSLSEQLTGLDVV